MTATTRPVARTPAVGRPDARERHRDENETVLSVSARLKQRGNKLHFVIDGASDEAPAGPSLVRRVARAQIVRNRPIADGKSVDDVARKEGFTVSYVTRLLRLSFLAPDIVTGILAGRYRELTARKLIADTNYPPDWPIQRDSFAAS